MKAGAKSETQTKSGKTALTLAADHMQTKAIQVLIDVAAAVEVESHNGPTALVVASKNGGAEVVETLLNPVPQVEVKKKSNLNSRVAAIFKTGSKKNLAAKVTL